MASQLDILAAPGSHRPMTTRFWATHPSISRFAIEVTYQERPGLMINPTHTFAGIRDQVLRFEPVVKCAREFCEGKVDLAAVLEEAVFTRTEEFSNEIPCPSSGIPRCKHVFIIRGKIEYEGAPPSGRG